jgi:hypothetical protein
MHLLRNAIALAVCIVMLSALPSAATDNDTGIHWHTAPTYRISTTFPDGWVTEVAGASAEWTRRTRFNPTQGARIASTNWADQATHIVWRGTIPAQWQEGCPPSTTLGCTSTRYNVDTRHIIDADIVLNSQGQLTWTTDDFICEYYGWVAPDVQYVMLHEFGHFGGLGHTPDQYAVMYQTWLECRRTLTAHDVNSMQANYPGH